MHYGVLNLFNLYSTFEFNITNTAPELKLKNVQFQTIICFHICHQVFCVYLVAIKQTTMKA